MKKETIKSLFEDIYGKMESGVLLNNNNPFSKETLRTYKATHSVLKKFKKDLLIDEIDEGLYTERKERVKCRSNLKSFVNSYIDHLIKLGYHPNTRKNHIKHIKSILNKASEEYGYSIHKLKNTQALETEVTAMTPGEVEHLHKNKPGEKHLRTWYYARLMLYSCMRIGDMNKFKISKDQDYVNIITSKGSSLARIFLPGDVKEFILNDNLEYNSAVFTRDLKELLKSYDIFNKTKTRYKFDKDGNSYAVKEFLWQIYTPHKLRSSGISWYLSKGLPEYQVKKISGHSANSRAFYRYVAHADTEGIENQKNIINEC
tara:strand:+ start:1029 stop:1976 length:948 start_codon:yes stop_codon:yes gene_type:complete